MTLEPLLAASPAIQIHTAAALAALALGTVQVMRPRGSGVHKRMGWLWVALMAVVALSSFGIHELRLWGPWSPIHILSVITLVGLWGAVRAVRQGRILDHRRIMMKLFWLALIGAGAFTLVPGRLLHQVVFG
jgi:uncharacterized membrane protein